ncbi:hypothetical protein OWV82_009427 [Melia azedarach]|uniref:Uncharacterized protein n=1 Tax=Melia azedarach TaxID=155640 RepID=A0ACC1YDC0_MELAZ|nr:hypothetical protein OWV82_009427 [Melia azedarach]
MKLEKNLEGHSQVAEKVKVKVKPETSGRTAPKEDEEEASRSNVSGKVEGLLKEAEPVGEVFGEGTDSKNIKNESENGVESVRAEGSTQLVKMEHEKNEETVTDEKQVIDETKKDGQTETKPDELRKSEVAVKEGKRLDTNMYQHFDKRITSSQVYSKAIKKYITDETVAGEGKERHHRDVTKFKSNLL